LIFIKEATRPGGLREFGGMHKNGAARAKAFVLARMIRTPPFSAIE
jgi:hypothetical protein